MKLNIYNNFKAFYYNTLVNFYLYFNTLVPYYDDVIMSLSITSFKNIINNSSISLKTINQNRMMQLLYSLNDKDNIILDDDGFIFINNNVNGIETDNANNTSEFEEEPEEESEAVAKVEPEEEPEAVAEAVAEEESEAVAKVEPEAVAKVEPEAVAKVESEAVAKVESEAVAKVESDSEVVYDIVPESCNILEKKNN